MDTSTHKIECVALNVKHLLDLHIISDALSLTDQHKRPGYLCSALKMHCWSLHSVSVWMCVHIQYILHEVKLDIDQPVCRRLTKNWCCALTMQVEIWGNTKNEEQKEKTSSQKKVTITKILWALTFKSAHWAA